MAEKKEYKVQATLRVGRGKNDARRARRDGMVPITVYGGGAETVAAVAPKDCRRATYRLTPIAMANGASAQVMALRVKRSCARVAWPRWAIWWKLTGAISAPAEANRPTNAARDRS